MSTSTRRTTVGVIALVIGSVGLAALASAPGPATAAVVPDPVAVSADGAPLTLTPIASYETGIFDGSAQEIVAYHPGSNRLFTVNAELGRVEVLDAATMTKVAELDTAGVAAADGTTIPDGAVANSVDVRRDGLGVIAVESDVKTDPGWLVLFDADAAALVGAVRVGALPDMVTITPTGRQAVVANEAEPSDDFTIDPEGSISVVALPRDPRPLPQAAVRTAGFHRFEEHLPDGVRVFGPTVDPEHPVSTNLEPEYVAVDGDRAYVTLQENNAIAVVDLRRARILRIMPLGFRDYGVDGAGLDPSDRDNAIDIRTVPGLRGLYLPDALATYRMRGRTYLVTANEGDAREWGDYVEGARVKDLGEDGLPPVCASSPLAGLTDDATLGRLNVTTASGLSADGSCYEDLYTFGTRSFSIWTAGGRLVYDSGDQFEQVTAAAVPGSFNSNHTETNVEGRSDDKGPEPEGIDVGSVRGRTYAFVGFERVGGVIVFDVTHPADPVFVTYVNNRDFAISVEDGDPLALAGDLGPEGVTFLAAGASPTGRPMLAVANEVSGSTTLFSMDVRGAARP